jgi:hypothetical protein
MMFETEKHDERAEAEADALPEHPEAEQYWAFFPIERIRDRARAGAMSLILVGALVTAPAEASQCKGLAESPCAATPACRWIPERKAGETRKKDGTAHKTSAKAHCRARSLTQ